jgi:chromosome partitioning protein
VLERELRGTVTTRRRAVIAQKGGVAKTTTVANLAAAWGGDGRRVLAVDADPQFDLTRAFGHAPSQAPATLLEVILGESSLEDAVIADVAPGVDLLAGHRDLKRLELTLVSEVKREEYLAQALRSAADYDEIVIDCPPNLGLLTVNALFAAPEVIVPVSMRDSAALQSAGEVRRTVATLADRGVDVHISAVVRTMADSRRLAYRAIAETVPALGLPVARTEIPMLAAFDNSVVIGTPLVISDPDNIGAVAYRRLADELSSASRARHLAAVS